MEINRWKIRLVGRLLITIRKQSAPDTKFWIGEYIWNTMQESPLAKRKRNYLNYGNGKNLSRQPLRLVEWTYGIQNTNSERATKYSPDIY